MFFIATVLFTALVNGQTSPTGNENAKAPVFKSESVRDFLQEDLEYPYKSRTNAAQGVVIVEFAVNPDGRLSDYSVINSVSPLIDEEVIRAIKKTGGKWDPGYLNCEPVKMHKEISVTFKLYPEIDFVKLARRNFEKASRLLYEQENPERALVYLNRAINFMPYDETLLMTRAICKNAMGDHQAAKEDEARLEALENRTEEEAQDYYVIK